MTLAVSPTWTSAKLEGERDGRLRFPGELAADELELAGARRRSIPCPLSDRGGPPVCGRAHGRELERATGVGPRRRVGPAQ
jgi:hypothetical protein